MIIPKGKPIHKELSSSFVDLAKLVEELRTNGFSGTIDLVGLKHEGEILMEHGSVVTLRIQGEENFLGKQHLNAVLKLAKRENLLISTYLLPPESVVFLRDFLSSERIFENLSSEFTDPKGLINKFEQEEGVYFIEVVFQKNLGAGILFIQDHQLMDALLSLLGKDLSTGASAIQDIVEGARELGATFNVYKGIPEAASTVAPPPEFALNEIQTILNFLLVQMDKTIPRDNRKGFDFDLFVRESLLAMAEKYPFLDPFAAEFVFKDGQLELNTAENHRSLLEGAFALIQHLLEKIRARGITFPLDAYRQTAIGILKENHGDAVSKLRIEQSLNSLL
jgi:hypothetical protein